VEDGLFDDELVEQLRLVELEEAWVRLGEDARRLAEEAGYTFEPETFVITEIARAATVTQCEPELALERFEKSGLPERVVERLEEGPG
jgi:hypothetical protein